MATMETHDTKVVRYFIWAGILWGLLSFAKRLPQSSRLITGNFQVLSSIAFSGP
jgi:hypothetical protein